MIASSLIAGKHAKKTKFTVGEANFISDALRASFDAISFTLEALAVGKGWYFHLTIDANEKHYEISHHEEAVGNE